MSNCLVHEQLPGTCVVVSYMCNCLAVVTQINATATILVQLPLFANDCFFWKAADGMQKASRAPNYCTDMHLGVMVFRGYGV